MTVAEIQRALLARGYDLGPAGVDGDAGPKTIAAVTAFQRAAGLVADGIAGPLTQKALGSVDVTEKKAEPDQPAWLTLAGDEVGTVEGIGKSNNPKVIRYFADAGFSGIKDDAVAWCAALVGAMLHRAGRKPSGSLAARSYESWGVGLKAPDPRLHRHEEARQLLMAGARLLRRRRQQGHGVRPRWKPERCGDRRGVQALRDHRLPLAR